MAMSSSLGCMSLTRSGATQARGASKRAPRCAGACMTAHNVSLPPPLPHTPPTQIQHEINRLNTHWTCLVPYIIMLSIQTCCVCRELILFVIVTCSSLFCMCMIYACMGGWGLTLLCVCVCVCVVIAVHMWQSRQASTVVHGATHADSVLLLKPPEANRGFLPLTRVTPCHSSSGNI